MVNWSEGKISFLTHLQAGKTGLAQYPWQHCWCAAKNKKRN